MAHVNLSVKDVQGVRASPICSSPHTGRNLEEFFDTLCGDGKEILRTPSWILLQRTVCAQRKYEGKGPSYAGVSV